MRALCIISQGYPHYQNPVSYPFVKQFAHAVARQGVKVSVIAPLPIHVASRSRDPEQTSENVSNGTTIEVFYPRYLSVSSYQIGNWNTVQLGYEFFNMAVKRVLQNSGTPRPDALYGHFLYMGGAAAVRLGIKMGIPAFPMVGEGLLNTVNAFGKKRARRDFAGVSAFMANSSCLAGLLQDDFGVNENLIGVFPNGIDHVKFYQRDKALMRGKYGLPQNAFIVICVAFQDLQKGPVRVGAAIRGLYGVKGVFLGKGPNPPQAENIIVNKMVLHDQVPEWLSAADVFVLPSTFEGCCNAALEAMSCGLPVISSTGSFNDDILNEDVSIRVNPMDVGAIRRAIIQLKDDVVRRQCMAAAALKWSKNFDINRRACNILRFMESHSTMCKDPNVNDGR